MRPKVYPKPLQVKLCRVNDWHEKQDCRIGKKKRKRQLEGVSCKAAHTGWFSAIKERATTIEQTYVIGLLTLATFTETLISVLVAICPMMMSLHR